MTIRKLTVSIWFLLAAFSLFKASTALSSDDPSMCNFFLIKEVGNEVIIEKATLMEGQVQVFRDPHLISYIMIFAPGSKSGEIIEHSQRINGIIASYAVGTIKVSILQEDGTQKQMPEIDLVEAKKTDVRLNVTGHGGYEKAYFIEKYDMIRSDHGPVLDMFAGQIPLSEGDFSLFTECLSTKQKIVLTGSVPYKIYNNWVTVECIMPDGRKGRFVVDFGASNTVLPKSAISPDAEIIKYEIVEYSKDGIETSNAVTQGASGVVDNIAGIYIIDQFKIGNIFIDDLKATVLEEFPLVFTELGIDGIIGRDILTKADIVEIRNLNTDKATKEMVFLDQENEVTTYTHNIPFKIAGGHLFVDGTIGSSPISFLFDSGAANSWLSKNFLTKNKITYHIKDQTTRTAYGLDGQGIEFVTVDVNNVNIGSIQFNNMEFDMSEIFALQSIGLSEEAGLLGMNFLTSFESASFNFQTNNLMLWE